MFKVIKVLAIFFLAISCSPKLTPLERGNVSLIEMKIADNYELPNSILFLFKGHTHSVNYFLDLEKSIRSRFYKHDVKIAFLYDLKSDNPLQSDLKIIPKNNVDKNDYSSICHIELTFISGKNNFDAYSRKQTYYLNLKLNKSISDKVETNLITGKLLVNSYYTILTQNENTSKIIFELLNSVQE